MLLFGHLKSIRAHNISSVCAYGPCSQPFEPGTIYFQFYYKSRAHGKVTSFWRNLHKWCLPFWLEEEHTRREQLRKERAIKEPKVRQPRKESEPYDPARQKKVNRRNYLRRHIIKANNLETTLKLLPEFEQLTKELEVETNKDRSSTPESLELFNRLVEEARYKIDYSKKFQAIRNFYRVPEEIPDDAVEQFLARRSDEVRPKEDAV